MDLIRKLIFEVLNEKTVSENMTADIQKIYNGLGGDKFAVLSGSSQIVDRGDFLAMKLHTNKSKANYLKITPVGDNYDMKFYIVSRKGIKTVDEVNGVSYDDMQSVFNRVTGLRTPNSMNDDSNELGVSESKMESQRIDERQIEYNNEAPYGQIVFLVGGAGSGKGFARDKFLSSRSFKVRDVDVMKTQLQKLNELGKISIQQIIAKYGHNITPKDLDKINKISDEGITLSTMNLRDPNHVYALHILVRAMGLKEKTLSQLLKNKNNPETLPNIIFDITGDKITKITSILPDLISTGYKPENIHITWVLTNYETAVARNKNRDRVVASDIQLSTHEGAALTVWGMVNKVLPKDINGRIDVILANTENTVFFTDADGKAIKRGGIAGKEKGFGAPETFVSDFTYINVKQEGKPIKDKKYWNEKLFNWIKKNAPKSITSHM